jgi:hypothetical protein
MSEDRDPKKEYDQAHGTPTGADHKDLDTASTAMPLHERPLAITPKSSGGVE